jgi:hypothetical protein
VRCATGCNRKCGSSNDCNDGTKGMTSGEYIVDAIYYRLYDILCFIYECVVVQYRYYNI